MKKIVALGICCAAVWVILAAFLFTGKSPSNSGATARNPSAAVAQPAPAGGTESIEAIRPGQAVAQEPAQFARGTQESSYSARLQDALVTGDAQVIDSAIISILPAWMAADPMGAMKYVSGLEHGDRRDMILNRAIGFWTMKDPGAALQCASQWADPGEGRRLLATVCLQEAQTNPQAALTAAESAGLGRRAHDPAIEDDLFDKLVQKDSSAALSYALSQAQGERRDRLVQSAAIAQAGSNPYGAAQTVLSQIPAGDQQDAAMGNLLRQFVGGSVSAGASPQQDSTVIALLQLWAARNPNAAAMWVRQLPPDQPVFARANALVKAMPQ